MWSMPAPPSASGMATPVRPSSAAFWKSSRGNLPFSSFSRARGLTSASAKSRTLFWRSFCSSVSSRFKEISAIPLYPEEPELRKGQDGQLRAQKVPIFTSFLTSVWKFDRIAPAESGTETQNDRGGGPKLGLAVAEEGVAPARQCWRRDSEACGAGGGPENRRSPLREYCCK